METLAESSDLHGVWYLQAFMRATPFEYCEAVRPGCIFFCPKVPALSKKNYIYICVFTHRRTISKKDRSPKAGLKSVRVCMRVFACMCVCACGWVSCSCRQRCRPSDHNLQHRAQQLRATAQQLPDSAQQLAHPSPEGTTHGSRERPQWSPISPRGCPAPKNQQSCTSARDCISTAW